MPALGSIAQALAAPRALERRGAPRGDVARADVVMIASAALLNLLGLALPLATLHVYDSVLPNAALESLAALTIGLIAVALLEMAIRILQTRVATPSAAIYARDLKLAALERELAGLNADGRRTPTETLEQLGAVERFTGFFGGQARLALVDLPFSILALGLIAALAGWVALAPIAVIALYLVTLGLSGAALRKRIREREDLDLKSTDFLHDIFSAILTVKSWALEALMLRRYERLLTASTLSNADIVRLNAGVQRLSGLFSSAIIVATLGAGAWSAIAGNLSIGTLAATTLLAGRAAQPALRAAKAWNDLQRAAISADATLKLFASETTAEVAADRPLAQPRSGAPALATRPEGDDVGESGGVVRVDGGDAGQRTAALEAIAGLRSATASTAGFTLDGLEPRLFRAANPGATAMVARSDAAFRGSVLENLTLFGRGANALPALSVSERLGLDDEVRRLPEGYDTPVGDAIRESLSPAGQKKLILARAIAQGPRLLILDEPTAQLGRADVHRLADEIASLARTATIVMATTDASLGALADRAIALDASTTAALEEARA